MACACAWNAHTGGSSIKVEDSASQPPNYQLARVQKCAREHTSLFNIASTESIGALALPITSQRWPLRAGPIYYRRNGCASCIHWLAWSGRASPPPARQQARVKYRLSASKVPCAKVVRMIIAKLVCLPDRA